jgi:hypothetical protein
MPNFKSISGLACELFGAYIKGEASAGLEPA